MNEYCEEILAPEPDRIQWLKARRSGIGSSDVSAILGLSQYKSPLQVWWEKLSDDEPHDNSPSEQAEIGSLLEPQVAELFTRRTGKQLETVGLMRSKRWPWMIASCDRAVVGEPEIVECKTAGFGGVKEWKNDEVPDHAMLQVTHQLAVLGYERAYVAGLLGDYSMSFHYRVVERDEQAIEKLVEAERLFWVEHVQKRVEPSASGVDLRFLQQRREPDSEQTALVDHDFVSLLRRLGEVRETKTLYDKEEETIKALIAQRMGNATKATLGDGNIIFEYRETAVKESYRKPTVQRRMHITTYGKEIL